MKVVSPAITSVRKFVPRSENLKKAPKVPSPLFQAALEPEEGLVLLPEEPGHGGEPEPDYGRVGGEDLAVVLGRVAGLHDRDALIPWQPGPPQALLRGVVEDDGPDVGELAPPDPPSGLRVGQGLHGLEEQVIARLFEFEVEVGRAVARGDRYPGVGATDLLRS